MSTTLDMALRYDQLGWSTLPLKERSKAPAIRTWKQFQKRRPDQNELADFFGVARRNIAVICGDVSGRLVVRDFDIRASYDDWQAQHPDLARSLPTVATVRGCHVYACTEGSIPTRCLDDGELRSSGGYVVAPPSIHPHGPVYTWMVPPGDRVPVVDLSASGLLGVTQEIGVVGRREVHSCVTSEGERDSYVTVGEDRAKEFIARAIRKSQPSGPGQRHDCIFTLVRYLRQIGSVKDKDPRDLEQIFRRWFRVALPVIRTKDYRESWKDFCYAWREVRFPVGMLLQAAADRADESSVPEHVVEDHHRRLAAICRELQLMHGDQPFFLDCRNAGLLLEVSYRTALRMLNALSRAGVLRKVSTGSWQSAKANEYRYVGPLIVR